MNAIDPRGLREAYISPELQKEIDAGRKPNPAVGAGANALGVAGVALESTPLGGAGAVISIANDPSPENIATNAVGSMGIYGTWASLWYSACNAMAYAFAGVINSAPGDEEITIDEALGGDR